MSERIHFSPLGSADARLISRLQRKLFARELTESADEIRQILENTEQHMVCNLSFGVFDGSTPVGYSFAYVETRSLFHERDEEVIYIKEIALLPGYEGYLRRVMQKLLALREVYAPQMAFEAHAVPEALATWQRLRRFFRLHNIQLNTIPEPPRAGRPDYRLLRFEFGPVPGTTPPESTAPVDRLFGDASISVVTDSRRWLSLRPQWDAILDASAQPTLFLTFDYLWEWWRHFGVWHELHMLVIRRDGEIVGIAPLMIEHITILGKSLRRMRLIGSLARSARPGFLFGRNVTLCTSAMLAYFEHNASGWDVLSIEFAERDPAEAMRTHFRERGHPVVTSSTFHASIDLDNMLDSRAGSVGALPGKLRVRSTSEWPALEAAIDAHCEIEERSTATAAGPGVSSDKTYYFFYTALAKVFGCKRSFIAWILESEGVALGSSFGILWRDVYQSLQATHDSAYAAQSPASVLLECQLDSLGRDGVRRYEMIEPPAAAAPGPRERRVPIQNIHVYRRRSPLLAIYVVASGLKRRLRRWNS